MRLRTLLELGAVPLALALSACSDQPTAPASPASLHVDLITPAPTLAQCGQSFIVTAKATNANGKGAVEGLLLNFNALTGGGSMFGGAALTNDKGLASDIWTLGRRANVPNTMAVRTVNAVGVGTTYATMSVTPLSKIAFASHRSGRFNIVVVNPDGSNLVSLTDDSVYDNMEPAWSPDGSRIAFLRGWHIWVMNADGSKGADLTPTAEAYQGDPAWSPDGSRIAYHSSVYGYSAIWVMSADGSNKAMVGGVPGADASTPTWSPDGRKIAFSLGLNGETDIWVMNADGSNPTRLTHNPTSEHPAWSEDGTLIAFDSDRGGHYDIYVMDPNGANVRQLTNDVNVEVQPGWSPDGGKIVYANFDWAVSAHEIYVMNADGSNRHRVVSAGDDNFYPDWSGCTVP